MSLSAQYQTIWSGHCSVVREGCPLSNRSVLLTPTVSVSKCTWARPWPLTPSWQISCLQSLIIHLHSWVNLTNIAKLFDKIMSSHVMSCRASSTTHTHSCKPHFSNAAQLLHPAQKGFTTKPLKLPIFFLYEYWLQIKVDDKQALQKWSENILITGDCSMGHKTLPPKEYQVEDGPIWKCKVYIKK